jgi:hypothetical protein
MKFRILLHQKFIWIWFFLLVFLAFAHAQEEQVTLILQSGEEVPCRISRIAHGNIYFEAASTRLAFKYGEMIEIEKVSGVRLGDGRTLSTNDYLALRRGAPLTEEPRSPQPPPTVVTPMPVVAPAAKPSAPTSGPGLRLMSKLLDTTAARSNVGLRLPEQPLAPPSTSIAYTELANLLAETGQTGKLLYEINVGVLRGRELTKSQKQLVDAILQSTVWIARKQDLREAQHIAEGEFNLLAQRQPDLLSDEFRFRPTLRDHAFLEFVQFLHIENVLHFEDEWKNVETIFGEEAASALRDILNNYEDWHYLFGREVEKK